MQSNRPRSLRPLLSVVLLACAAALPACKDDSASKPAATSTTMATPPKPTGAASAAPVAAAPGEVTVKEKAPAVPNAAELKKYAGTKVTYFGGSVGSDAEFDKILAKQFQDDTGIQLNVVPQPRDANDRYANYQRLLQAKSEDADVLMIDIVWPGAFALNLVDLTPKLGEMAKQHIEGIVQNNTIDGKLVAMPWFTDFGLLYYRTDLLEKYGYKAPPETWDDLEAMAKKIQDGEKPTSPNFVGFVWQGKASEALSCDALEWLASSGAGTIIEGGKITLSNPQTEKALSRAHKWVGGISPAGVTGYAEEDARNAFQGGNAAFMRNWPYAYAAGNAEKSIIKGKFAVAPLPHEPGQKSVGTIGGWQLAVSKFSKNPDASIEFIRYMTSPEAQKFRAVGGSFIPTIRAVQQDADVVKALPFLASVKDLTLVARPSSQTGERYNEASIAFYQGVSQVLQGKPAKDIVGQTATRLERMMRK